MLLRWVTVFLLSLANAESNIVPLSSYVSIEKHYMLPIISGDDQHIPMYLGCKPTQLEFDADSGRCDRSDSGRVDLPESLKLAGDEQIKSILEQHEGPKIEQIEMWPALGAFGFYTWVYARALINSTHWMWFNESSIDLETSVESPLNSSEYPYSYFPALLFTSDRDDHMEIFDDILQKPSLYQKPAFGDCLWTSVNYTDSLAEIQTTTIYRSWLPVEQMHQVEQQARHNICVVLPQPARLNGQSYTLLVRVTEENEIVWPSNIHWLRPSSPSWNDIVQTQPSSHDWHHSLHWPNEFASAWRSDMYRFSGHQSIEFANKTRLHLTRKSSIQADNQLLHLIDYLVERYQQMNIETTKQYFTWRNITQANLIAVLPAGGSVKCSEPVLFIDHIDTAFEGDTFESTGTRRTTPGADDNVSGLIALLQSAAVLKESQKTACRDIWLVHLTGEEYPAASLGVVYFLQQLLHRKQPIYMAIIVDMISHRVNRTDPIVQINPSDTTDSIIAAQLALDFVYPMVRKDLILTNLTPIIRPWHDPYSYLYNTDGVRFVEYGFSCILFNEHINYNENFERDGYHDTMDTIDLIDFEYGQTVTQYAAATVAMLAHVDCSPPPPSSATFVRLNALLLIALLFMRGRKRVV